MTRRRAAVLTIACVLAPLATHGQSPRFAEDFQGYTNGSQFGEGALFGPWKVEFGGFGAVRVTDGSLELIPAQTSKADVTHSVLVTGPSFAQPMTLEMRVFTGAQLRVGNLPNPWEAAWIMWGYTDVAHSYYFLPKPNGWELAKRDPAYHGGQRIMATGNTPSFKVNNWYGIRVEHRGNAMTVLVDGVRVASFVDEERPYSFGKIALYSEDAAVRFDDIKVF